jgi:hypothetical protein
MEEKVKMLLQDYIFSNCAVSHDNKGEIVIVVLEEDPLLIPLWDLLSTRSQFEILEKLYNITEIKSIRFRI